MRWRTAALSLSMVALAMGSVGCVRRTIAITSTPSEALVFVNDREVGRTPCEVEFLFYGQYDVRLKHDGYEPVIGSGNASAPIWDFIGADLASELAPVQLESKVLWHFDMVPADHDHARLFARALDLKKSMEASASELPPSGVVEPATAEPPDGADDEPGQGALPPKGSSAVPVPPTELPKSTP